MNEAKNPSQNGCRSPKPETSRQAYIRVLKEVVDGTGSDSDSQSEAILHGELILGNYLDGNVIRDSGGSVVSSSTFGITVEGRRFLQQLQKEESDESNFGRLKKLGLFASGIIVGVFADLAVELLKPLVHLK